MELRQFKIHILPLRSRLMDYAQKLVANNSDAEDVVQEIMLKLWDMREKLEQYNSVEALAVRMTHNLCVDLWRKKRPDSMESEQLVLIRESQTPEKQLEEKDEIRLMREIIFSLPALQQTIIRMKDIEEYETTEIAEITGCSHESIRSNLSRARKKVKEVYLQIIQEKT